MSSDERPVALVTGGGSGIGAAIARRLAADYRVVICGRRPEPITRLADTIGGVALVCDLNDLAETRGLPDRIIERLGRLDALVLNAGIVAPTPVAEMSLDDWQAQLTVNLTSPFVLVQAALPHLLHRQGRVVGIASVAAHATGMGLSAYSASKAGLIRLIQSLAFENARQGLRANAVSPGWVRTEMGDMEMAELGGSAEEGYAQVTKHIPQRRAADASEIAGVVAFLLSDAASFINGSVVTADGGGRTVDAGMLAFDS
ncbi:MAG: dehydrogenase [Rhodobacterales bacterium 65-51]|uniref:SDR family NAD(P)-dependent oxidoreductase n=1 Tax=uncultured Gemmobacter sp. TaxID=1095917 RepID=UPI0009602B72|nr:SDR family NAD(P)-dependent oxidoreductase [uncultured Gemmobacter sp.]OJY31739.1 MAG: dehydrogenase [Rhodobacterales bacterium 65-51]